MTIIDPTSGYHNLKCDRKPSYITTFACQFGRYMLTRLCFGVAPTGDMFQRNVDKIFKGLPNIFGMADEILIVGYDADSRATTKL